MTKENQSTDLGRTEKEEVRWTPGHQVSEYSIPGDMPHVQK